MGLFDMIVTVQSGGPACILHPLISSVLVADTSGKTGVVGIGSNGWRVEDAMINGGQAVDTVGNKNIKTPQSLSPAHTPCLPHRKYGSTNSAKSNILLI